MQLRGIHRQHLTGRSTSPARCESEQQIAMKHPRELSLLQYLGLKAQYRVLLKRLGNPQIKVVDVTAKHLSHANGSSA
jgi:hypothetical protein